LLGDEFSRAFKKGVLKKMSFTGKLFQTSGISEVDLYIL
jgi:hypothetical protein